ncbi:hypothetical protein GBA52_005883 [Prunus armeniaca]|nr:hypothetical protein GBA52_005883 [Prunus armeniaca]
MEPFLARLVNGSDSDWIYLNSSNPFIIEFSDSDHRIAFINPYRLSIGFKSNQIIIGFSFEMPISLTLSENSPTLPCPLRLSGHSWSFMQLSLPIVPVVILNL